jgi:hypothetical protein
LQVRKKRYLITNTRIEAHKKDLFAGGQASGSSAPERYDADLIEGHTP